MNLDGLYLRWEKNVVLRNHLVRSPYHELLAYLHTKPYSPRLDWDINRYNDGVEVRLNFCEERPKYKDISFMSRPCTMFELLLGMAFKLKHITESVKNVHQTEYWFWKMLDNMGLLKFDDDHFNKDEVDHIVDNFIAGNYPADGTNTPFHIPLSRLPEGTEMNKMDLWSQAMLYLDKMTDSGKL